jgi:LysM repeat protein
LIVVTVVPPSTPVPQQVEYTVQLGDTLTSIAANFGTTADAIMALNGLSNANLISAGQVLLIPGQSSSIVGANEYVVVAGDTLYSIAQRFGTTVAAIQRANGIVNPALIRAGQKLTIPPAGSQPPTTVAGTYVVQAGDTLYGIAAYLGKNVWDIIAANNLTDPYLIYPGQALTTP